MRRTWWPLRIIAAAMLLALTVGPSFAMEEERLVTVDLRDALLVDALRTIFRDSSFSFTLSPGVDKQKKVTLTLNEVPFSTALRAVADAANVDFARNDKDPQVYRFTPRPTVTVGGAPVPVVGAVTLGPGEFGGGSAGGGTGLWTGSFGVTDFPFALERAYASVIPPAGPEEKLVDLDVKNASLAEAMAQLAKASGLDITVHPAVPQSIKVTARAFAVPAEWLLEQIVSQAHLMVVKQSYPEQPAPSGEALKEQLLYPRYRYHIVPPPQVTVTGAPEVPALKGEANRRTGRRGLRRLPMTGEVFFLGNEVDLPSMLAE